MRNLLVLLLLVVVVSSSYAPWAKKVKCSDPQFSCPSDTTCCEMDDGSFGCCPIQNAVCCSDHIHCCPSGATCDIEEGRCVKGNSFTPIHRKRPSHRTPKNSDVICPDKKAKCPSGTTCCQLAQGSFGCCPVPNAVCCPDKMHCCPNGFTCDSTGARCLNQDDEDDVTPWYKKFPSTPLKHKLGAELVDGESREESEERDSPYSACGILRCPTRSTCCAVEGMFGRTQYMCCPLSNGVCCDGFCCPSGYECAGKRRCEKRARHPFI